MGKENAFSMVEIMVAMTLFAVIGAAFIAVYLTGDRLVRQGLSLANIQAIGRIGMEKMERYLRTATSATVLGGGDQLSFVVDTNGNPYSPNYVTESLVFDTGDGDESSAADNTVTYDPNTAAAGDEVVIMSNVRRLSGNTVFSVSGKVVSIRLMVSDVIPAYASATYSGSDVSLSTDVYMRN